MSYSNPFIRLGLSIDTWSAAELTDIRKKRKEFLAELEASSGNYLHIHGDVLGKNDLIRLFDDLEDEQVRQYHAMIAKSPSLHDFLHSSRLDYFYEGDVSMLSAQTEGFLEWIAPWFTHAYNLRLTNAFQQKDSDELHILCTFPLPFSPESLTEAYKGTYQLTHEHRERIQTENDKLAMGQNPDGSIYDLTEEWLITCLNHLPEYFQPIRDAIAGSLEQVALTLFRRHERSKLSLLVIRQALKLDISPTPRKALEEFQKSLFEIHPEEEWMSWIKNQEKDGLNPWIVAAGVGAAGLAIWLLSKWRG